MKFPFKNALVYCALALLLIACSGDDEASKTNVKYLVTSTSEMITGLTYRNASGEMAEAVTDAPLIEWTRSINVDLPFDASLEVETTNGETEAAQYDLAIYIDGELKNYILADTPGGGTDSSVLEFEVN